MSKFALLFRQQDAVLAGRLHNRFTNEFGSNAISAISVASNENDMVAATRRALARTQIVLVLIGPEWTTEINQFGQRRIDDPADPMRIVIEEAMALKLWVVPIMVRGAVPLFSTTLPFSLQSLANRLPGRLRNDPDFEGDLRHLVLTLAPRLRLRPRDVPRWVYVVGSVIVVVLLIANIAARGEIKSHALQASAQPTATATPKPTIIPMPQPYHGTENLSGIAFSPDGKVGWIIGNSSANGRYITYQDGQWRTLSTLTTPYNLQAISVTTATEAWALGSESNIFHYVGQQWTVTLTDLPQSTRFRDLAIAKSGEIWAVGGVIDSIIGGQIQQTPAQFWHYHDGVWSAYANTFNTIVERIALSSDGQTGWAVGTAFYLDDNGNNQQEYGHIFHYQNGAWGETSVPNLPGLFALAMRPDLTEGWAMGIGGSIFHYVNGHWFPSTIPFIGATTFVRNLQMLSPTDIWGIGDGGLIIHYDGYSWHKIVSPVTTRLNALAMLSPTEGWAVGDAGTIIHYSNGIWKVYQ